MNDHRRLPVPHLSRPEGCARNKADCLPDLGAALPKAERKRLQVELAANSPIEAKVIKFGDKISNVLDVTRSPGALFPTA